MNKQVSEWVSESDLDRLEEVIIGKGNHPGIDETGWVFVILLDLQKTLLAKP